MRSRKKGFQSKLFLCVQLQTAYRPKNCAKTTGSDFRCFIGRSRARITQNPRTPREVSNMASSPPTLLLVEDHEDTRKMLELLFEEWGYRATMVGTATEGLRHLLANHFDLIILDNWLPDLDGIELCSAILGKIGRASCRGR